MILLLIPYQLLKFKTSLVTRRCSYSLLVVNSQHFVTQIQIASIKSRFATKVLRFARCNAKLSLHSFGKTARTKNLGYLWRPRKSSQSYTTHSTFTCCDNIVVADRSRFSSSPSLSSSEAEKHKDIVMNQK